MKQGVFIERDGVLNLVRVEVNRLRAQQLQAENRIRTALIQLRT